LAMIENRSHRGERRTCDDTSRRREVCALCRRVRVGTICPTYRPGSGNGASRSESCSPAISPTAGAVISFVSLLSSPLLSYNTDVIRGRRRCSSRLWRPSRRLWRRRDQRGRYPSPRRSASPRTRTPASTLSLGRRGDRRPRGRGAGEGIEGQCGESPCR
jgi:hypothetical protein